VTISGKNSACQNEVVTLTALPAGGSPPYSIAWSTGATSQAITTSSSTPGSFTFSVTVTDHAGATASASSTLVVTPVCKTDFETPPRLGPPQLPLLTTFVWGCGFSFAGQCLTQTIVQICVGGQCFPTPAPPQPPICRGPLCVGLVGLGVGAVVGIIAGVLLQRSRRREERG
jgi:hypothetical protein